MKSHRIEESVWGSRNLGRRESTAKARDLAVGAVPTGQSFDVTIYIYADIVLER